jgi:O-antigen/teichoic acid export membrane protein
MTLRQKTLSALKWSFADNFVNQGIQLIVGIILARLLSPKEFGLIGMMTIFIAISQSFIDSGFSQALIRKDHCTKEDYSTVFFYNLIVGTFLYLMLFLLSGTIGNFYNEPILPLLVKILGLNLIIGSFTVVQRTILTKNIDFKLQTNISIVSSMVSGAIGIVMAYLGWGVWSLIWKTISQNIVTSILLWMWNGWRPVFVFSRNSFREMFGFSSKLLVSALIDTTFTNIYYLVIGKYFSAIELGYYTRADQFRNLPSQNITNVIQRVSYPVLSAIKDDAIKLKQGYKRLIKNVMFLSFVLMVGMAAVAKSMVGALIGERWLPVVPYLQLLCLSGMLYPLHALNLNILKVMGRSDLFLSLEVIKKTLVIPVIVIGVVCGIKVMIVGMFVNSIIAYFINSFWSSKLINYSMKEQIIDIVPALVIAIIMGMLVWLAGVSLHYSAPLILSVQLLFGGMIVIAIAHSIRLDAYVDIREIVRNTIVNKTKSVFTK